LAENFPDAAPASDDLGAEEPRAEEPRAEEPRAEEPHGDEPGGGDPAGPKTSGRSWKGIAGQVLLLAVGLFFFAQAFSGVDLAELGDAIKVGSVPLLILALAVGQLPRFTWAIATRAASPKPVPYRSVALLQLAIPFFNLLAPYTVARMAVNIRFFQRQGVPSAAAVSIGAIDTLGGTISQILILVVTLLFGFESIHIDFQQTDSSGEGQLLHLAIVVLLVVVIGGLIAVIHPGTRRRLLAMAKPWLKEGGHTLAGVRSPTRLTLILGGNLGSELLLAATLSIVVHAFGASASYLTLLVVVVGVGLFASLIPVPGGIGVVEGSLVIGLTAAGIDQATAIVCAITYRLCTYYLPPIWGWFAYRELRRRQLF
jgi:glycosyltransferase 2 family protein